MGRRAKHWLHVLLDSGLPGLIAVIAGCIVVTLRTAQKIDHDEYEQIIAVTCLGSIVAIYRVWNTNRKQRGNNG